MIKDVTLGQYFPGKSIIHKLDPRVKVLLTLVNIVFIFIAGNFSSLGLMTVFTLVAMLLSGVPFTRYIRSIRGVLFIVLFTSILNLFYGGGTVLVQWGFIQITTGGIRNCSSYCGAHSDEFYFNVYHISDSVDRRAGTTDEAAEDFPHQST